MRKRLNILCVIVLLALSWSVIESAYYFTLGASMGFQAGWNTAEAESKGEQPRKDIAKFANLQSVHLRPPMDIDRLLTDSVLNEKSGTYVPATYYSLLVSVPQPEQTKEQVAVNGLLACLTMGLMVWALVLFVRLMISINRYDIFTWRNVRRLRLLGLALLLSFACELLTAWLGLRELGEVFSLRGYEFSLSDMVERITLVLGLCSLIVGEVFAIGLRLKEEQDLTI